MACQGREVRLAFSQNPWRVCEGMEFPSGRLHRIVEESAGAAVSAPRKISPNFASETVCAGAHGGA